MSDSRAAILARVRAAVGGPQPPVAVPRDYLRRGALPPGSAQVVELLVDRLVDYHAVVHHATAATLAEVVDRALAPARSVVVPADLDPRILEGCAEGGREVVIDGDPAELTPQQLDAVDAVVTEATVAIATTGTIVLDGGRGQGRRAVTLVPDRHLLVVRADQVVETVAEGLARVRATNPTTMVAGPSATSDIELSRVEGVHGPRTLTVVVVD